MNKFLSTKNLWFYFLCLLSFILLFGEVINERLWMHDLEVYYKTAVRMLNGSALYRIAADGHYVYKYSPSAAIYFIPLTILPFQVAKIIYWLLLTVLFGYILHILYALLNPETPFDAGLKSKNKILALAVLAVGVHWHRELHLGQVNLLLLVLYVFLLKAVVDGKRLRTGFLLALTLFIKPFGLIFYPYLLLRNKYKEVLYSGLFIILLGLLPFLFYPSVQEFKQLYISWFNELFIELRAKQSLLADANHTIFSVFARYTPISFLLASQGIIRLYQLIVLAAISLLVFGFIRAGQNKRKFIVSEFAVLIALIPLLAFTSENAFLFTTPAIVVLIFNYKKLPTVAKYLTVAGCILIGANIRDLFGSTLYNLFVDASVYTFGAVVLILALFLLRKAKSKKYNLDLVASVHNSNS